MTKIILPIIFLCLSIISFGQTTLDYETGTSGIASPEAPLMPHWLIYNRNGIYDGNRNEAAAFVDASFSHAIGKKWKLNMGMQALGKWSFSNSYLHEAYLNVAYGKLKLRAGKEELTLGEYNEKIGSGSFYVSNNARPVPRIGLGFYEYIDVPFTNSYVQVKGFLNQGILEQDRGPSGTSRPLLHEKAAYIRSNNLTINPHFGILHYALFGGTRYGTEIPVDYIATVFAKSSKKVGKAFWGEETNVAGGHFGLFDFGLNFKTGDLEAQTFLQKPVKDRSGFAETFRRNKDYIFGLSIKNQHSSLIREFVYERINTTWQGGPGIPDAIINGKIYLIMPDKKNFDKILKENYGIETNGISEEDFWRIVRRKENYGFEYGGRDNYYNNGMYYRGFSYYGNALGNSLLLTVDRIKSIYPQFDDSYDLFFANTRVSAHHFGFLGNIAKNLDYKFMLTFTNNLGTYAGLNKGVNNWDSMNPDSDYHYFFEDADYFVDGKYQFYTLLETSYSFQKLQGLQLTAGIGLDWGKMYHSYGCLLGLKYSGSLIKTGQSAE